MDPLDYISKRKNDLINIESDIAKSSQNLCKQPFQRIPRFLRRRAASHNSKRLPVRFRNGKTNMESRAKRMKPADASSYLETGNWYSKRAQFCEVGGISIPYKMNEKLMKASVKAASNEAFIYDLSFCKIECHRVEDGPRSIESSWTYDSSGKIICQSSMYKFYISPQTSVSRRDSTDYCIFHVIGPLSKDRISVASVGLDINLFSNPNFSYICVLKRSDANKFWIKMVKAKTCVGGLLEYRKVTLEQDIPLCLHDFDCLSDSETFGTSSLVLLKVLGRGRPSTNSMIYDKNENLIGYIVRSDFSEIRGCMVAFSRLIVSNIDRSDVLVCRGSSLTINLVLEGTEHKFQ